MAWTERLARVMRPFDPLVRATRLWDAADGMRMSAAMSFYGILSLAPLLLVIVAVLGWWMDRQVLQDTLVGQIGGLVGPRGAAVVEQALSSAQQPAQGLVATVVGFGVLLFGATGVFGELQEAFARVWTEGGPAPRQSWWHGLTLRLRGVAYILAFGFLLLVSLVVSTLLTLFSGWLGEYVALETGLRALNELAALGLCALLFVALMRLSPGRKPAMRFLLFGAVVGAILFGVGRQLLSYYLATAAVVSAYGAAGSLVVVLMWLYFSSAVLLFGASCAKAFEQAREEGRVERGAARGGEGAKSGYPPLRAVAGTGRAPPARRRTG